MSPRDLIRFNHSSTKHAQRIERDRQRRPKTLPSERPINPPARQPMSLEQVNALFDQHFKKE